MPTFPATRIDSQTCSMALSAPGLPRTASRKSWSMRLPTLSPKASTRSLIRRTSSSFHGGSALSPALFTTRPSSVYVGPPGPLVVTHSTPIRAMKLRAWSDSPKAGMVSLIVPFNSAAIPSGATPGRAKAPGRAPDHVYGHADDVRHGGFVERDMFGYREEKIRPAQTVLGVGARVIIHLFPPLSVTHVNRVPAQILAAGTAEVTLAARPKRLHSDASAEQVSVCGRVNLDHDSGIFVSENDIGRVWDVAAQRVQRPRIIPLPITQVATADPASLHLDQDVVLGRQARLRHVGPVELSRLPQDNSLHSQAPPRADFTNRILSGRGNSGAVALTSLHPNNGKVLHQAIGQLGVPGAGRHGCWRIADVARRGHPAADIAVMRAEQVAQRTRHQYLDLVVAACDQSVDRDLKRLPADDARGFSVHADLRYRAVPLAQRDLVLPTALQHEGFCVRDRAGVERQVLLFPRAHLQGGRRNDTETLLLRGRTEISHDVDRFQFVVHGHGPRDNCHAVTPRLDVAADLVNPEIDIQPPPASLAFHWITVQRYFPQRRALDIRLQGSDVHAFGDIKPERRLEPGVRGELVPIENGRLELHCRRPRVALREAESLENLVRRSEEVHVLCGCPVERQIAVIDADGIRSGSCHR